MSHLLLTISSGTGPIEVRRFVRMLADELAREVVRRGAVVDQLVAHGPEAEPSSMDLTVIGAPALVANLVGTHALIQRSDRRGKRDRKRWFAGVTCAQVADAAPIEVDPRDLVIDTCRASGAGGQHVNKTESAVRAREDDGAREDDDDRDRARAVSERALSSAPGA